MRIEEGKFYRTRAGKKVGPYSLHPTLPDIAWVTGNHDTSRFLNGRCGEGKEQADDLVAEWTDGPVRTVTRREIVPGIYGRVNVIRFTSDAAAVRIVAGDEDYNWLKADELRAAATVLNEIADALSEAKGSAEG